MPIPNDYREICEMLMVATHDQSLKWSDKRGTIAVRAHDFDFEIWSGSDDLTLKEFVAVGLRDPSDNELIDSFFVEEGDTDFPRLSELFRAARQQARGVNKKLEALRDLLKQSGKIGE